MMTSSDHSSTANRTVTVAAPESTQPMSDSERQRLATFIYNGKSLDTNPVVAGKDEAD